LIRFGLRRSAETPLRSEGWPGGDDAVHALSPAAKNTKVTKNLRALSELFVLDFFHGNIRA
jgi:hypothetical protein